MGAAPRISAAARVLVIDDDEGLLALVGEVLREGGFEPVLAASAAAGLASAREQPPEAVLLDVNVPQLSGYEICRLLREEFGEGLPILFLSGERTESFDRVAGLLLGADDYLAKPFAPDELVARVRTLVRRAAPVRHASRFGLTHREQEVLDLLADGLTQAEIARALVISPRTCGKHIERILVKLDVHSRSQAIAVAYRDELVSTLL